MELLAQNTGTPQQSASGAVDAAALLQSMRDIHLPEVSGSQLAPGWVLLVAGLLLLTVMLAGFVLRRRRSADWRLAAQQELAVIQQQSVIASGNETVAACSRLLRRVSLALAPRQQVASMTGESWLNLLDGLHGSIQFSKGPGRVLAELPYARPVNALTKPANAGGESSRELLSLLEDFIAKAQPMSEMQIVGDDRSTADFSSTEVLNSTEVLSDTKPPSRQITNG